ncbi:hypothetical protein T459_08857 [Capsicum annuum]|uniref:Cupin type-1 domain-containing protein n=1 Tax=Capsicum annuum TaxID=4072 RepID=A0A2G2ZXN0_CAPAN|nr:hypothetical protein T459_08853 [Capsicum annuum]PHT86751.1 hypothetical protein T459_08857 [Capsicum annuum]
MGGLQSKPFLLDPYLTHPNAIQSTHLSSLVRPNDEEEKEFEEQQGRLGQGQQWWQEAIGNGLEENICTIKVCNNIETQRRADIFSKQARKVNHVARQKLPILKYIDMSSSKGTLTEWIEFVVFRTRTQPMNNQLAGYTSVIRAMPVEVLTNAYQISLNEAQCLKLTEVERASHYLPSKGSLKTDV